MTHSPARPEPGPYSEHPESGQYVALSQTRLRVDTGPQAEAAFAQALREVRDAPESSKAWDTLEQLCEALQTPDQVAEAYLRMLTPARPELVRDALARRAVAFYDCWFGDDEAAMRRVLEHVIETCADAQWAFDRLVSVLTAKERWDALLEAYDRALLSALSPARRRQLLDDAAHVAKDFTDRPERAIDYLRELLKLEPGAHALCASLERVLTDRKAFASLVALWQAQLDAVPESTTHTLRLRMARVHLEELGAPFDTVREASNVLGHRPGDDEACSLLEQALALPQAELTLRLSALHLLRLHHDSADRPLATIAALERALDFAPEDLQIELRRELAARLMARSDDGPALLHYAELLRRVPTDADARAQLLRLSERSGDHAGHARALVSAAEGSKLAENQAELLLSAMHVAAERVGDLSFAIALGQRVLTLSGASDTQTRTATEALERWLRQRGEVAAQLDILERLEKQESSPYRRRLLVCEIAEKARAQGQPQRALTALQAWLAEFPRDLEALTWSIELSDQLGLRELHVAELERRALAAPTARQRREDRKQAAVLREKALGDLDAAIDTWLEIRKEFGDEPDLLQALDELLSATGRYSELVRVFDETTSRERSLSLTRLCRLGDVHRLELEDYGAAARAYARALELDPGCPAARSGLTALLGIKGCAEEVTGALERAYQATDDFRLRIELADARIAATDEPTKQARVMLEVAQLCEERDGDPVAALRWVGKAFPRLPNDTQVQRELLRLAELTSHAREAASALHYAALAVSSDRARAGELSAMEGRLLERLAEHKRAAEAFEIAVAAQPLAHYETHALIRNAALAGDYGLACKTAMHSAAVRGLREPEALGYLTVSAREQGAFVTLAEAFGEALRARDDLSSETAATLELDLARLLLDECSDLEGAQDAAQRALAWLPLDGRCLRVLADVQRLKPSDALLDTLLYIDERGADSLSPLIEAAELLEPLNAKPSRKRAVLTRLFLRACALAASPNPPAEATRWLLTSLERLIPLELAAGASNQALQWLDAAVRLPLSLPERARLRRQTMHILHQAGDLAEALHVGLTVLEQHPRDLELTHFLGEIAQTLERVPEQLTLRSRELELTEDGEARLALRLEVARLTGVLEGRDARLTLLRANLVDAPGHESSLERACDLLLAQHRLLELRSLLSEQAAAVGARGESVLAASLWRRASLLSEKQLNDLEGAVSALEQTAKLTGDAATYDELVRLSRALRDPRRCARFLAERLALSPTHERSQVLLELAHAQLEAGDDEPAIATLQVAFDEDPRNLGVRELLTGRLGALGRQLALADVLARAAKETRDAEDSKALAVQAARLYHTSMERPEALVAVTDLALGLSPDDVEMCGIMADGLRALGRFEEARQVLLYLLAQYGRRRSSERAAVHVKLAQILGDEEDLQGACAQLELALNMQSSDVNIMMALAERSAEALDLSRRERALRALLLSAKRGPVVLDDGRTLGVSEVLLQLSELARERGDLEQASSLRESALEALRLDDPECKRIKDDLRARGEHEVLAKILRQELAHAISPAERAIAMGALAELLSGLADHGEEAIELRLSAVELDPSDPRLHDAAEAACASDALTRFGTLLEALRSKLRRPSDAYARCEVCLRLAGLHMAAGNLDAPLTLLEEAEGTRVREGDVWRAQLRLSVERKDTEQQTSLLSKLDSLGCAELGDEERVDVLYRLAEIRLAQEATRSEGLSRMQAALTEAPRPLRAARVLLRVLGEAKAHPELLTMFGEVASRCSTQQLLHLAELCVEEGDAAAIGTLLSSVSLDESSTGLRVALLTKRARLLFAGDARDDEAAHLLSEALSLAPQDAEAEALLVAYYEETAQWEKLTEHLARGFSRALAERSATDCVRYALALHRYAEDGNENVAVHALRETLQLTPDASEVRAALLSRLTPEDHAHERGEVLEQMLVEGSAGDPAELGLEAASLYEACGDLRAAVQVLELSRKQASNPAPVVQKLLEMFRAQDDAESLSKLLAEQSELQEDEGQKVRSLREAARLRRERLDDVTEAVRLLERAVTVAPEDAALRAELATDLLSMGRLDEAVVQLGEAADHCEDDDERALLLHVRGKSLLQRGDTTAAIADLEAAFALSPLSLAGALIETLEEARCDARDAGATVSQRELTFCLAKLRRQTSDLPQAAELLEIWALQHDMGEAELTLLVSLYAELDWASDLARCLALQLAHLTAHARSEASQRLLEIIPQLDDLAAVREALSRALCDAPFASDLEDLMVAVLMRCGDDLALAKLWRERAQRRTDPVARTEDMSRAAQHLLKAGENEQAIDVLRELVALSPTDVEHALALADALIQQNLVPEGRALLLEQLASSSEGHSIARSRLLLRLAQVERLLGDTQAALQAMQAARDADTANRTILGQLAVMAEELGAWAVAENALTSVLLLKGPEVMPRSEALLRRARVAIHHSGKKRALLWARKALEAAPDSQEVATLISELEAAKD